MTDILEIIIGMVALLETVIQPAMDALAIMLQIVQAVAWTPTYTKDIVDVTMATMDMIAPIHLQSEMHHTTAPAIMLVEEYAGVQNHMTVTHVEHILI